MGGKRYNGLIIEIIVSDSLSYGMLIILLKKKQ